MSDLQVPYAPAVPDAPAMTQVQRVISTFTAPSKTFADIKRNTSWWLPFLIAVVFTYAFFFTVQAKVGWDQVAENQIRMNPKQAAQMEKLTPEQRATQMAIATKVTEGIFAIIPIFSLIGTAIIAGVLLATINFGFGGKATFWQAYAVCFYGGLPGIIKVLLGIAALLAGAAPESFNSRNFSGTNIGYYLPPESNKAVMALATSLDIVTIWTLVLYSIGISIIAGTKRNSGYIAVSGWWILIVLIGAGWAVAFG
jgi:Yip1 domain